MGSIIHHTKLKPNLYYCKSKNKYTLPFLHPLHCTIVLIYYVYFHFKRFIESFTLTSEEQAVLSRGRNANLTARKKGKSANNAKGVSAYQDSTAFEALIGYTYITDKQRFIEIMSWMKDQLDEMDDNS